MSTKTITITEEAYNRLKSTKSEDESFTDAIMKITKKNPLDAFTGILSKAAADDVMVGIAKSRQKTNERMKLLRERLS